MSSSHPPRLASALMRWMGPRDEALIGDLLEAYQDGKTDRWYWRQVFAAIAFGAVDSVRAHPVLALRAVVLGWLMGWLYANYLFSTVSAATHSALNFKQFLFVTGLTDWFYVHDIDPPAFVVRHAPDIVAAWLGTLAIGWIVGRLHRPQAASLVLVFCVTMPLPAVAALLWRLIVTPGLDAAPLVFLYYANAFLFMVPHVYVPTLLGGLWATRPRYPPAVISSN
jgi:hypothetical protein